MVTYEDIKKHAQKVRGNINSFIALSRENDPFYAGNTPATRAQAEWFTKLWHDFGFTKGNHLRGVHYKLVSQKQAKEVLKPNGERYENTDNDWQYLTKAAKYARYLGLVDYRDIVDRRNPKPHIHARYNQFRGAPLSGYFNFDYKLPDLEIDIDSPIPNVTGYEYSTDCQPYHLELWIEKSTMDEILLPCCERYEANLVTGEGFQSVSNSILLLDRIQQSGKPGVIFYISDFDASGVDMPKSVARQVEYWREKEFPEVEVKIKHIALTPEQVKKYELPSIPIKEKHKSKAKFEKIYGVKATELDALEANEPGKLREIVSAHLGAYYDTSLKLKYSQTEERAIEDAQSYIKTFAEKELKELEEIKAEVQQVAHEYRAMREDMKPMREKLSDLQRRIDGRLQDMEDDVELPERPVPDAPGMDESEWLFDTEREYFEQLKYYSEKAT